MGLAITLKRVESRKVSVSYSLEPTCVAQNFVLEIGNDILAFIGATSFDTSRCVLFLPPSPCHATLGRFQSSDGRFSHPRGKSGRAPQMSCKWWWWRIGGLEGGNEKLLTCCCSFFLLRFGIVLYIFYCFSVELSRRGEEKKHSGC